MTCDWWVDPTRQCHRPARALFRDWIKGQEHSRCGKHDTQRKRREMKEAGFSRYDVTVAA